MSLPLLVRPMASSETSLVLAAWKHRLAERRYREPWGRGLDGESFWLLVNHVLDRITLPSCDVHMGCYETEPGTPLCWVALRGASVLYADARHEILKDPPLAATLERELLCRATGGAYMRDHLHPFKELSR